MAGTKNTALSERNRRICLLRRNGFTYGEIAEMEQISRPRVAQIYAEYNAELGEDDGRAEIAGILEFVEAKAVGLVNEPGFKMRPDGSPAVGPNGETAPDNGVVVEALKVLILVGEKKGRLFGWEKQQKRMDGDAAMQAYRASIAVIAAQREAELRELAEARRAGQPVVPGEVIREIGPAQPEAS